MFISVPAFSASFFGQSFCFQDLKRPILIRQEDVISLQKKETPKLALIRYVEELANEFEETGKGEEPILILASLVAFGRRIAQPLRTKEESRSLATLLSGRRHRFYTGIYLKQPGLKKSIRVVMTHVACKRLSEAEIEAFVPREHLDGARPAHYDPFFHESSWIKSINGSLSNLMGVPVYELKSLLQGKGII